MNWIYPVEAYNKINLVYGNLTCLSRPHYMLIFDIRPEDEYDSGHVPTAKRLAKTKAKGWHTLDGLDDLSYKQTILLYDMKSNSSSATDTLIDAANDIWARLHGSQNQNTVCLLNGGFEKFTEFYPNCKSYQSTNTRAELSRIQVLPLHIPIDRNDLGRLCFCASDTFVSDRSMHIMADIDAHVSCSVIRDKTFGFSAHEDERVYYCVLENASDNDCSAMGCNLRELHNVCLFAESHLKEQRNVLIYGEPESCVAAAVIVALLLKLTNMGVEAAYSHLCRCCPSVALDCASEKVLTGFQHNWINNPEFQSNVPFMPEVSRAQSILTPNVDSSSNFTTGHDASVVASKMNSTGSNKHSAAGNGKSTESNVVESTTKRLSGNECKANERNGDDCKLRVSREEIRLLEEEIQWKIFHEQRNSPVFNTFTVLEKGCLEQIHDKIKRLSSLKAPIVFERKVLPKADTRVTSMGMSQAQQRSADSLNDVDVEIHAAASD
ncbi:serine/threonine/tyrosine-interacting-like protein 1 [Paramacrobiotus metropolitanus]|uniref:serine/threonine/tyrosine-interacting-like protein 1 n=1 Tax=Paramacrobiotus metropolitanus TaxID=2943436 RepID=UPI002445CB3B|nr:serine/threonine/tyrosine-interacting-like protein 1 [Paramacrobiotus metropolitanus]